MHLKRFLKTSYVVFSVLINKISKNTTFIWDLVHLCYFWKKYFFCFTHFSRNDEDSEMSQLKKFWKLYCDAQKLFNDSWHYRHCCFKLCYMLFWGIAIIFKLHLVSRAAASRKNWCVIFRDHIFNRVPKKFAGFYWSLQLTNLTVNLKFEWNMVPIY